ncbi:MAG: hypothetical protein PHW75_02835 [Patescibacteria group bacterium]|nr:hypothetical protein [Patescibacteria group bacterium]
MASTPEHLKPGHVYAFGEDDFGTRDALLSMLCSLVDYLGTSKEGLGYTWPVFNAMNDALDACRLALMQPRFILARLLQHGTLPDDAEAIAAILKNIRDEVLEHAASSIAARSGLELLDGSSSH